MVEEGLESKQSDPIKPPPRKKDRDAGDIS